MDYGGRIPTLSRKFGTPEPSRVKQLGETGRKSRSDANRVRFGRKQH